jgi:hypothetical protein
MHSCTYVFLNIFMSVTISFLTSKSLFMYVHVCMYTHICKFMYRVCVHNVFICVHVRCLYSAKISYLPYSSLHMCMCVIFSFFTREKSVIYLIQVFLPRYVCGRECAHIGVCIFICMYLLYIYIYIYTCTQSAACIHCMLK